MNNTTIKAPVVSEMKDHRSDIESTGLLKLPSFMPEFLQEDVRMESGERNIGTKQKPVIKKINTLVFSGKHLNDSLNHELRCPWCAGKLLHIGTTKCSLKHLPFGGTYTALQVQRSRLLCPECRYGYIYPLEFKAQDHLITAALEAYTEDLLSFGFNLKSVAFLTGLNKNIVKDIDVKRLKQKYTTDGISLKKPDHFCRYLAIDEFKLHDGHKYATVIADLQTGHILWLAHGRKKECVYGFIDHVGKDFMDHVTAIACDMNSDFEEAFRERCPHTDIVYDRFHIMKNFNDKVISEVRKDEQKRLKDEGDEKAAFSLKHSKYILMASRKTRERHDQDVRNGKLVSKESVLFNKPELRASVLIEEKYRDLISSNELLFTIDLVKEQLDDMFSCQLEKDARDRLNEVIETCKGTNNSHFIWFSKLLENHFEGIVAYSRYRISTSKLEGINNMIKTERRLGYGYPDDEYFFLRIIDRSHRKDSDS